MKVNLFILGLGDDIDIAKLTKMFSIYGPVDSLHIATDERSSKSLGYGFVQMKDELDASLAVMALNGMKMKGKTLAVRIAEKKNNKDRDKPIIPAEPAPLASQPQPVRMRKKRPRLPKGHS